MDFLDPQKVKAHKIRLLTGYALIGAMLILATTVLLYQAYGFGLKNGKVIQNGFVYVSSNPSSANIFINGKLRDTKTTARLSLEAGQYTMQIKRDGYRDWKRALTVEGGSVEHFDYAVLFPKTLRTTSVKTYDQQPNIATQSPDHRWLITQSGNVISKFELTDLKDPKNISPTALSIPDSSFTKSDTDAQGWQAVQWSADNRHLLMKHTFQKGAAQTAEYILIDRQDPTQTLNVSNTWGMVPTSVELINQAYDRYYLYDQANATLKTARIDDPTPKVFLDHVLSFESYGNNVVAYVTAQDAPAGKVSVKLKDGDASYDIRTLPAGSQYTLDVTKFSGDWFVAAGATSEGRAYVYKNPQSMIKSDSLAVPVQVLKVPGFTYLSFSPNSRFVVAENAANFAVYDVDNDKGYAYTVKSPLDAPQTHASWMDGSHLAMTSNGKTTIFDFDQANTQTLITASATFLPFFDRNYDYVYTVRSAADATNPASTSFELNSTALRTPADL